MANFLTLKDSVNFSLLHDSVVEAKKSLDIKDSETGKRALIAKIAASHAGIITLNNMLYLPNEMKDSVTSFTKHYQKPILTHHNRDAGEPIGRVIDATYIDTSLSVIDAFNIKDPVEINDCARTLNIKSLNDFISGNMPYAMAVDYTTSVLQDNLFENEDYAGLGFAQITAKITDEEAIEKLLDGRYLTGSVHAQIDKAVCSICKQDWAEAGKCEHTLGNKYKKGKCFLIPGKFKYKEYSFVNKPADSFSSVLSLHIADSCEDIKMDQPKDSTIDSVLELSLVSIDDAINDNENFQMEDNMKTKEELTAENAPVEDKEATEEVVSDEVQETAEVQDTEETTEVVEETAEEVIEDAEETVEEEVEPLEKALSGAIEGKLEKEQVELLYDAQSEELEDAKLSTESRKKLPKSAFCGPDRSFPVHDKAHYTAALRLLGRYKGPGDKEKIRACILRKGKAKGWDKETEDQVVETPETAKVEDSGHTRFLHMLLSVIEENEWTEEEYKMTDEEQGMIVELVKKLVARLGSDSVVDAVVENELVAHPDCTNSLEDEVIELEDKIVKVMDALEASKLEYIKLQEENKQVQDEAKNSATKLRQMKETQLLVLAKLKGEEVDSSTLEDSILEQKIEDYIKEIDFSTVSDRLNNGLSRQVVETIDDPNVLTDNSKQKALTVKDMEQIEMNYWNITFRQGPQAAQRYMKSLMAQGLLPISKEKKE